MSTTTRPRAPRNAAAIKASKTQEAQAVKVAAQEAQEAQEMAVEAASEASLSDRQHRYIVDYRSAEATHGTSKHAANVAAVAYFRTLPESVTITTAKSKKVKPVSARDRAAQTLEALCVSVERDGKGKVVKGNDALGFTVQRVTQLVDAFENAERTGVVKVETLANPAEGETGHDAEEVEALVSALDQARVVGGKKAAEALASSIRETVESEADADGSDGGDSPLRVAVETAQSDVVAMRDAKKEQEKSTPVVKTGSQNIADAVTALWDAIEANASDLDSEQKSALLAKMQALQEHAAKHLA